MNITILSVGNKMPSWIKTGYQEYTKRLSSEHKINLIELAKPEDMLKKIPEKNYIIALDEKGEGLTTELLSKKIDQIQTKIQKPITFLIGAADGLPTECKEKAHVLWSLSPLTFPHMLVRVILVEQIYRAFSVLKNHPYHREGSL
jgi:23S rRNA (pseudouridine1915-N3)-methyltransferase